MPEKEAAAVKVATNHELLVEAKEHRKILGEKVDHLVQVNAERVGEEKSRQKFWRIFGAIITTGVVASITWAIGSYSQMQLQAQRMERMIDQHAEHVTNGGHSLTQHEVEGNARQILILTHENTNLARRLDEQEEALRAAIAEMRPRRRR